MSNNKGLEKEIEILDEEKRSKKIDNDRKELEVVRLRQQLQINSFDAGGVFEDRTQMNQRKRFAFRQI